MLLTSTRRKVAAVHVILFSTFFISWLPTLHCREFSNSIENIVVETALETRRDGHWLIPRMLDEPRTRKPPLAAWTSAIFIRPATIAALDDPTTRDSAYTQLAREMRLPALLAACLTIAGAFELGRVLAGFTVGVAAAIITGTSLLFLEYARLTTPDTYLMLWVTWCNAMLSRAIVRKQSWIGFCAAGVFLGLAIMTKGPVALLQTVVPVIAFCGMQRRASRRFAVSRSALLTGSLLFLAIALPWFLWILCEIPGVWRTWFGEVTRADPADPRPTPWYAAFYIVRHFMPWTLWVILGAVAVTSSAWKRRGDNVELALWLFLLPLVVMSFFSERQDRYAMPMIPAGAVLAGLALVRGMRKSDVVAHYILLVAMVVITSLVCAKRLPDARWIVGTVAITGSAIVVTGLLLRRLHRPALIGTTIAVMLLFDVTNVLSFSRSKSGKSDAKSLADLIVSRTSSADARSYFPGNVQQNAPVDLSIYLNRVVRPVESLTPILESPRNREQIAVIASVRDESPVQLPAEWEPLGVGNRGSVKWHAFVRRAVSSADVPE